MPVGVPKKNGGRFYIKGDEPPRLFPPQAAAGKLAPPALEPVAQVPVIDEKTLASLLTANPAMLIKVLKSVQFANNA